MRRSLARALREALRGVDLADRVERAARSLVGRREEASVIAIGKAAGAMLEGAMAAVPVTRALAIAPHATPVDAEGARVEVLHASHPLPDRSSVRAAKRALDFARETRGTLVVLISGGASSLVCAPSGVTLAEKRAIVRSLLGAEATIVDVTVVRRHLSAIKGGGLLRATPARRIVTLIASDVIGGAPHDIGSGPSVPDPTTRADARRVFARFVRDDTPTFVETRKPERDDAERLRVRIVARPEDLARSTRDALARHGFRVRVLAPKLAPVHAFVAEYARLAKSLRPGTAVVRAAEPTLRIDARRPGRGGRSSHLAAALLAALPPDVAFLAGASDGVDGTSGAAGAVIDGTVARAADPVAVARALAAFDTGTLHESLGTALRLGPTGHNLADVHVLARSTAPFYGAGR